MGSENQHLILDRRMALLVDQSARVEALVEDHAAFFEGPVWIQTQSGGHLVFTDIAGDRILKWEVRAGVTVVAHTFFSSSPASRVRELDLGFRRVRLIGPDGLAVDREGRILYCGYGSRDVGRLEADGSRTVLAESFGGKRLNTPNDIIVNKAGTIYFTDSAADRDSQANDPYPGVPTSAVYRIVGNTVEMLHDDFDAANGLAFTPDERFLYVNDTRRKLIWRYETTATGALGKRDLFTDMNSDTSPGVPDGMKVDRRGYVYCTGPQGLWIMAPDGKHLGTIRTSERLTNIAFGGTDQVSLYMTGPSYLWRIPLLWEI